MFGAASSRRRPALAADAQLACTGTVVVRARMATVLPEAMVRCRSSTRTMRPLAGKDGIVAAGVVTVAPPDSGVGASVRVAAFVAA